MHPIFDESAERLVVLLLHLFLSTFGLNLAIVIVTHLNALLVLLFTPVLVLDLPLDHVVEGQDVPSVVSLGLDHALGPHLDRRLGELLSRGVQWAVPQRRHPGGVVPVFQGRFACVDHGSVENRRES